MTFRDRLSALSIAADARDFRQMRWITQQRHYRARREYTMGRQVKRLRPLARIGMGV